MSRIKIKNKVLAVLAAEDATNCIEQLAVYPIKDLINPLFASICRGDEQIRWKGIYCFGHFLAVLADQHMESARIIMRRFLWSLNDESGGIGWGAPETMAEAMVNHSRLRSEYLHMLVSYTQEDGPEPHQDGNYLELPALQRGLLWALNRVAEKHPEDLARFDFDQDLADYLGSPDEEVVILAARCLIRLGFADKYQDELGRLADLQKEIPFYHQGSFINLTMADVLDNARRDF
ncbi:MAG: hypothetical protein CSB24_06195 [Deltaproteobacteria bacterium]|nr:MAG: hypothetical protein CSB24_06195 [Deltaproteobacteria bacterium]